MNGYGQINNVKVSHNNNQAKKVVNPKVRLTKEERHKRFIRERNKRLIKRCSAFVSACLTIGIISSQVKKVVAKNSNSVEPTLISEETLSYVPTINYDNYVSNENPDVEESIYKTTSKDIITEEEMAEYERRIEESFNMMQSYEEANEKQEPTFAPSDATYLNVDIKVPEYETRYMCYDDYNIVVTNYGQLINEYSNMYGVDPNLIASIIMVEEPRYTIENDNDYNAIGLGQFKGKYFDKDTFKAYNFVTKTIDTYTVDAHKLMKNPELQIKLICMTVANSADMYDNNIIAIAEHHNKGCKSVADTLDYICGLYDYEDKDDVLMHANPELIIQNINRIGDPNYSYKILYYLNMCLEYHPFNNNDYLSFYKPDGSVVNITLGSSRER